MTRRLGAAVVVLAVAAGVRIGAQNPPPPPVPKPFPQPAGTAAPPPVKPADPATAAGSAASAASQSSQKSARPSDADLGVRVYQGAEFLDSFDAGRGQRFFIFGTNDAYADVVAFYKQQRGGGSELFKSPPMQRFDLDVKFKEETMAFPPSVVVKDYTWNNSEGYLFIDGSRERRFRTIIQIVPAPTR